MRTHKTFWASIVLVGFSLLISGCLPFARCMNQCKGEAALHADGSPSVAIERNDARVSSSCVDRTDTLYGSKSPDCATAIRTAD